MTKISEMNTTQIEKLLNTPTSEDKKALISKLLLSIYSETDDRRVNKIREHVKDFFDAKAVADSLVNFETYREVHVELPDNELINRHKGTDGYIFAARLELAYNLIGTYAPDDELIACFR